MCTSRGQFQTESLLAAEAHSVWPAAYRPSVLVPRAGDSYVCLLAPSSTTRSARRSIATVARPESVTSGLRRVSLRPSPVFLAHLQGRTVSLSTDSAEPES